MSDKKDEEDKEFEKILQTKIKELGPIIDDSINEIVVKLQELHKKGIENNESVSPNELSAILGYEIIESPELQEFLASRRKHTFSNERDEEYVAHIANLLEIPSTEQANEQISGNTESINLGESRSTAESEESEDIRRANKDIEAIYRSGKLENIDEKTFNRAKSIIKAYNLLF